MRTAFLCIAISVISSASVATTLSSSQTNASFAHSLGNAFKNHMVVKNTLHSNTLATTYGGDDVSNKPLPTLSVIA